MKDEKLYQVILAPHISEKSTRIADKHHQFIFEVRCDASKPVIKQAVEKMFSVQVASVTVTNVRGKIKRSGKTPGRRQDWKKAYVTLKPGQDIDFAGVEAAK
jgi:large subunit ribosomal protein L23